MIKKVVVVAILVFAIFLLYFSAKVTANDAGIGIGIDFETEDFEPLIWMCDSRKVIDDPVEAGRYNGPEVYSELTDTCEIAWHGCRTSCHQGASSWCHSYNGGPLECFDIIRPLNCQTFCIDIISKWSCNILKGFELIERTQNYAFEGEKIEWTVLVMDKNKIEDITEVAATIGGSTSTSACVGNPEEDTCENYNENQCSQISGCELACDIYVDAQGLCYGNSPCYTTIQQSIDNSIPGDIICVGPGAYSEDLLFDESVELRGTSSTIIGEHVIVANNVAVDGFILDIGGSGTTFTIDSSNSAINGVSLTNNEFDLTTSPSIGVHIGGSNPNNGISDITMSHNIFDGPADQISNPWKIGGQFGSPIGVEVDNIDFECNNVNEGSIPINLHDENLNDILVNQNIFSDTDGVIYVWDDTGTSPTGVLSNFVFTNNDVDSSNTYGVGIDTANPTVFTVANFGTGNKINNNNFDNITGNYGFLSVSILSTGLTSYILDANNNWWGDLDPSDDVSGNVNFTIFKTSKVDIPECQPLTIPECIGTPDSCGIITDRNKCSFETEGCFWVQGGGGSDIEAECVRLPMATGRLPASCNARIGEEELRFFDADTMAFYDCTLTVETPLSMDGEYWITIEACDSSGSCDTMDETEYWFFNPLIAVDVYGDASFGEVRPGTIAYSDTLLITNEADDGSGVLLDMFISGTDFYDPNPSGARCSLTNRLKLGNNQASSGLSSARNTCRIGFGDTDDHICYFATNGAYSTQTDPRSDAEGYAPIIYGDTFSTDFYNDAEIMQPLGPYNPGYQPGNILTPGADIALTLKLGLPEPCNGDFTDGALYFWGEAI